MNQKSWRGKRKPIESDVFLLVKLVVVKGVCRGIYLEKLCKLEQISSLLVSNTNLEVK